MIYVFDTSPLIDLFRHYYKKRFPSLWEKFNALIEGKRIVSTLENYREIEIQDDLLFQWVETHKDIFQPLSRDEALFVSKIYSIPHFHYNIDQKKLYKGGLHADPFVIAKAANLKGTVVTCEKHKPNGAKIPNICEHFDIPCLDLEMFMEQENWTF